MSTAPDLHWSTTLIVVGIRQLIQTTSQLLGSKHGLPAFDTSHILAAGNDTANTGGLRWDAIHYAAIAQNGYQYEQQLAFMPLWPLLMRLCGEIMALTRYALGRMIRMPLPSAGVSVSDLVLGGGLINVLISAAAAAYLYK
jgi:phosphatidylinositol glycan class V